METLFVYGTLLQASVQEQVIGRAIATEPDTLAGFTRHATVFGLQAYPIISPQADDAVEGCTLEITPEELQRVDRYETSNYQRVQVQLSSGRLAWVYCSHAPSFVDHVLG
jgi:gamma-glutamylcyclotransferase (GGCT)/AIG2-like uncharacterized protein YtfP